MFDLRKNDISNHRSIRLTNTEYEVALFYSTVLNQEGVEIARNLEMRVGALSKLKDMGSNIRIDVRIPSQLKGATIQASTVSILEL